MQHSNHLRLLFILRITEVKDELLEILVDNLTILVICLFYHSLVCLEIANDILSFFRSLFFYELIKSLIKLSITCEVLIVEKV